MKKPNQIKDSEKSLALGLIGMMVMVVVYMITQLIKIIL